MSHLTQGITIKQKANRSRHCRSMVLQSYIVYPIYTQTSGRHHVSHTVYDVAECIKEKFTDFMIIISALTCECFVVQTSPQSLPQSF